MKIAAPELVIFDRELVAERDYWLERLSSAQVAEGLPQAFLRSSGATCDTVTFRVAGDRELHRRLAKVTGSSQFLLFVMLMAALKICLKKHSESSCIVVGSPSLASQDSSPRSPNLLAILDVVEDDATFRQVLLTVRQTLLDAYARQRYPFARLVEDLGLDGADSRSPRFDVVLAIEGMHLPAPESEDRIRIVFQTEPDELAASVTLPANRYRVEAVARLMQHFLTLLGEALENPDATVKDLSPLSDAARHQQLVEWNDTVASRSDLCAHALFEAQAQRAPDAAAVAFKDHVLSCGSLNSLANQLARHLQTVGVEPEVRVAICMERSLEMIIGMLAVLKAGGAYLPLDPNYPVARLNFMLEDSQAPVLLTEEKFVEALPAYSGEIICLDSIRDLTADHQASDAGSGVISDNLAYLIYTSGSTGQPKGVAVPHAGLMNLVQWHQREYAVSSSDRTTQVAGLGFDAAVWEIWPYLTAGAVINLSSEEERTSPIKLVNWLVEQQITICFLPTPLAEAVLNEKWPEQMALDRLLTGGDKLHRWPRGSTPFRLFNNYGPTENAVVTTAGHVGGPIEGMALPSIGRPIENTKIFLLDGNSQHVPIGVPGELHLGGRGLCRGYLNRPDLTAERLVPDAHSGREGARLYATGDLTRFLPAGQLEFVGRIDNQVKLRGYRIELGEIEAALGQHPSVQQVVVILRTDAQESRQLVAYLVIDQKGDPGHNEWRRYLKERLPEYMLPVAFVVLEAMPLTVNGKIDRRMLPAHDLGRPDLDRSYAAPRSITERALAEVWSEVLGVQRVGIEDNFFELGGDSIRSIQVAAKMQERGFTVLIEQLFEHSTIEQLAKVIRETTESGVEESIEPFALIDQEDRALVPAGLEDAYPLTRLQAGMIFHSEYSSSLYHNVISLHLRAPLDVELMQETIELIASRHSLLRTSFDLTGFSEPMQLVHPFVEVPIQVADLTKLQDEAQEELLSRVHDEEKRSRFDWNKAPLIRFRIYRRGADRFQLIMVFHHAIMDGWSDASLLTEIFQHYLYRLGKAGSDIRPAPKADFRNFVALEKGALASEESREYWRTQLDGWSPTRIPRWPNPGAPQKVRGVHIAVAPQTAQGLLRLSEEAEIPLKSVVLAAHLRVLSWLGGQEDITSGLVCHGRPEGGDGDRIIGLFLNTLPYRMRLEGGSWRDLARAAWRLEREMWPHRRYPLSEIQQRAGGETLFEAAFNFVHFHVYENLRGLEEAIELLRMQTIGENSFTMMVDFQYTAATSSMLLSLGGSGNELGLTQMQAMLGYYGRALEAIARDADSQYQSSMLLSASEIHQLLVEWNDTEAVYPDGCVHELIEEQARRTPQAVAILIDGQSISYRELNDRANQVANYLVKIGVFPGDLIAVCLEPSFEMIVGLLGVLKAGAAYVPLDPSFPAQRLSFMISDTNVKVLLAQQKLRSTLPEHSCDVVRLDSDWEAISRESTQPVISGVSPTDLAYVIHTSGSTGVPKGVEISHRSLVNLLWSMGDRPGLKPQDTLLAVTTLSFDIAGLELYLPLVAGGKVALVSRAVATDGALLLEAIGRSGATTMQATPSTWRMLGEAGWDSKLPKVLSGGEALPRDLAAQLISRSDSLWNMYGPTETTIWSTTTRVESAERVNIGRPIANTDIYILDQSLQPVPPGISGDLYIGGEGVARGYLKQPDLTDERFVANPFSPDSTKRIYRTGDLARYLPDGKIDFLGRSDFQVKLRGFRIELGEIETVIRGYPGVQDAVVEAHQDKVGERRLVAYVVNDPSQSPAWDELKRHIRERVPGYMVPARFVRLEALPLTPNGKVDRRALPPPEQDSATADLLFDAPRTPVEEVLAAIWAEILGLEAVGIHDDFFELGGHSLLATRVASRARQILKLEVPLRRLFETPTISGLAAWIEENRQQAQGLTQPPLARMTHEGGIPLSFAQQRLWFLDQLESGSPFYNVTKATRLTGDLNLSTLEQTFGEILRRHEVLRTSFSSVDGRPIQLVGPPRPMTISIVDLTLLFGAPCDNETRRLAAEFARRPFDLEAGPLLRTALLVLGDQDQAILSSMHHIVTDGWSTGILAREVTAIYDDLSRGEPSSLAELSIQYADFGVWQREWLSGEVLDTQLNYWRGYLGGTLPVLDLPTDRPRPALQSYRGKTLPFFVSAPMTASLKSLSRREGATIFMTLLAAFKILLYRYTGQQDIIVGTDVANRVHSETEGLIGFFVNQLVMRTDLSGDLSFRQLLAKVREITLGAYAHQDLPFELLVRELQPERDLSRTPFFQTKFIFLNVPIAGVDLPGLNLTPLSIGSETTPFDFVLTMTETADGLAGVAVYNTDLFEERTVARMLGRFQTLLESVSADPNQRIESHRALNDDEVGGLSLSDFPDADLSQKDFETLFLQIGRLQALS
jgi:amino acid adenylation domain-containing protein